MNVAIKSIPCFSRHDSRVKSTVFSVDSHGNVIMSATPRVTECTGATYCIIKPRAFDTMCRLIESRGERCRRKYWTALGDSPDGAIRSGYMCRDHGLDFNHHWVVEEELCSNGPEVIPWDDLQPILELELVVQSLQGQITPAFGL